jgi:uncharacterized protein
LLRATGLLLAALALLVGGASPAGAQIPYPPVPPDQAFVSDFGGLIQPADAAAIGPMQKEAFERSGTPIIVVTVASMGAYGFRGSIEDFARDWFNRWRIGTTDNKGGGNNGILLIVSVGDRRARIELGADWGRTWDSHCAEIMSGTIIPEFKRGSYSAGIRAGVEALAEMAAKGPKAAAPTPGVLKRITGGKSMDDPVTPASPIPMKIALVLVLVGAGLIFGSFFAPRDSRQTMLVCGIGLVVVTLVFYPVLLLIVGLLKSRMGGSGGSGGGGSYSGGGFSGGSSGGGGASGSW